MTISSTNLDAQELTFTLVNEFDAPVERVWQVWEDPRQLERWWGPPTWPATFTRHEFRTDGQARYYMSGPDGEKAAGWWRFLEIQAPTRLVFEDGFAGDDGEPSGFLGTTRCEVTLSPTEGGTRMTVVSHFESREQLEEMVKMGMEEGMTGAIGQIDAVLAQS